MEKQKETYREEAYELLAELETSLLELEETSPSAQNDAELIDRVFRALHTIKGSGAMFGFDDIAAFTHEVETVFDMVRDGKIPVTKELINLALSARDRIKTMLDGESSEIQEQEGQSQAELVAALRALIPGRPVSPKAEETEPKELPPPPFEASAAESNPSESKAEIEPSVTYRIRFHPHRDIFSNGTNPILLLNELRELGEANIVAQTEAIPLLKDYDPEACYTYWDIILTTRKGLDPIRDVFIFVENDCKISIEVIDEEVGAEESIAYKRLGEILIARGDISTETLRQVLRHQKRIGEMLVEKKVVDRGVVESALAEQEYMKKRRSIRKERDMVSSIRVPAERLDALVDLVGELVTVQARLTQKAFSGNEPELLSIAEEVERLTGELRDKTMSIRMVPVGTLFNKFKRLVRDLAEELKKEVTLVIEGGDTELDKTMIEKLNDPLVHLIRNAVDHGIEPPDLREAVGKPRCGTLRLSAEHSGAEVLIRVSGDGAGIDTVAVRAKAVEKGLISPESQLTEKEIISLIFEPGFSTARKISDVSGRGVGLDVVKRTVESLRGAVEILNRQGVGTTTILKLPLTLAIIDGLMVKIGESYFVAPLSVVEECVELSHAELVKAKRRNMMSFRGEIIPYLSLRELFLTEGKAPDVEQIIIAEAKDSRVGFGVDQVIGQYQTVIKTLGRMYKNIEGISGATILGDGTVALILDAGRLIHLAESGGK
jgi:two-component system chemotaxis sensor kinase CheA